MGFLDKLWRWLGIAEVEEEEVPSLPIVENREVNRKANLVSLQGAKTVKVVVSEPTTFEEAQDLADSLKNRRQVVLNLNRTDIEIARRIIDFLSGTTYALDGQTQKLGENIFLFAPSNVEISREPRMLMRNSVTYSRSGFGREE
ncbi:MAG: cell division protein SepF [Syntrophomonadaceae bacterium]|nr:cell division protein SepF [Syntrophomonadaceae bacterium]